MRHRITPEEKYKDIARRQHRTLANYAEKEFEWAKDLTLWYSIKKIDMPEDEYRACAFFLNREYRKKPMSLTSLYQMFVRCNKELPDVEKENAFDILRFKFKMYAKVIEKGGF